MKTVNRGGNTVKFRSIDGLLSLDDVAGVMGLSAELMDEWLSGWSQPQNRGLVEVDGKRMVRKKVVLLDWYDAQWIRYGLGERGKWPYPSCKGIREWRQKIHDLPVTIVKSDRKNPLKSL